MKLEDADMKIEWESNCKDAMWSMFWLTQGHPHGADTEALKEDVARLIRLTTQKTAGQRGIKEGIPWESFTPTVMNILCTVTALCLDGVFGDMPATIDEPD